MTKNALLNRGPKNSGMGRTPTPSFGQCPKENVFFQLMSSLSVHSISQYWKQKNTNMQYCVWLCYTSDISPVHKELNTALLYTYGLAEFEWKWRLVWFAALNEWLIIRVIWPKCKNCGRTIVQLQTPPSVLDFTSSFDDHRFVEWRRGSQKYKIIPFLLEGGGY